MIKKPLDLIGAAIGWGAQHPETAFGPDTLKSSGLIPKLMAHVPYLSWRDLPTERRYTPTLHLPYAEREKEIAQYAEKLAKRTAASIQENHFPIVLGGDHTIALGTWTGIIQALEAQQRFGLIWIDAHMDAHTIETTPSQAIHGMPLAILLGHGNPDLVNVGFKGPKLNPANVVLMGVRSYEPGEAALLSRENVKIYYCDEILSRGFETVFAEAHQIVKQNTIAYGISIDLDGFDPEVAPGVGSPAPYGLTKEGVRKALHSVSNDPQLAGFEIAEFNPELDIKHKTANWVKSMLLALVRKEEH